MLWVGRPPTVAREIPPCGLETHVRPARSVQQRVIHGAGGLPTTLTVADVARKAEEMGLVVTHTEPRLERLPEDKAACQRLLRSLGFHGLKIDVIVQPCMHDPEPTGIVYALTAKQWVAADTWRRKAVTIVVRFGDRVKAEKFDGWLADIPDE